MAIKIRRDKDFIYVAVHGALDSEEKRRADKIFQDAEQKIKKLDDPKNIDPLTLWHIRGKIANEIIQKYNLSADEKRYFWVMLYDASGLVVPEMVRKSNTLRNDFRTASALAHYGLNDLLKIGTWSLWREILGSLRIGEDSRVAKWIVSYILKNKITTRDAARPILKKVRNRLQNIDSTVLSEKELIERLDSLDEERI